MMGCGQQCDWADPRLDHTGHSQQMYRLYYRPHSYFYHDRHNSLGLVMGPAANRGWIVKMTKVSSMVILLGLALVSCGSSSDQGSSTVLD